MRLRFYFLCLLWAWGLSVPILAVNVNKRNGFTIQRNYTIDGKTPNLEVNGMTISATPTATATATSTATATATAGSSIVLVQQAVGTGTSSGITAIFPASITDGNALIVCVDYVNTDPVTSFDDVGFDTMTQQKSSVGTGIGTDIWSVTNVGNAGDRVTAHKAEAVLRATLWVGEFSGLNTANSETTNGATGVVSSTVTTGSVIPVSTNNLIIACGGWTADDYSTGPTNGFTRATTSGAGSVWLESAYKTQISATSASSGWGLTAGINWASAIASFGAP